MMLKKSLKKCTVLLMCACLLCGCTKSTIINPEGEEFVDLPMPDEDGLVWEQLWDDMQNFYADQNTFPFVESLEGMVDTENKRAEFIMLTNTEITREEAISYATDVILGFAYLVNEQNNDYSEPVLPEMDEDGNIIPGDYSYGSYLEQFEIYIRVAPSATKEDSSTWILEDTIPAGAYKEIGAETPQ